MKAGQLRNRLELQEGVENTRDAHGGSSRTWQTAQTLWARVEPVSGREEWRGQRILPTTTHLVTIRWTGTNITPSPAWRFVLDDRTLEIASIVNSGERNRELVMQCMEKLD